MSTHKQKKGSEISAGNRQMKRDESSDLSEMSHFYCTASPDGDTGSISLVGKWYKTGQMVCLVVRSDKTTLGQHFCKFETEFTGL